MTCETLIDWLTLEPQPRSFAGLMELYEHNYRLLEKLVGDLDLTRNAVSRSGNVPDLHLLDVSRHRYTTDLALTHYFCHGDQRIAYPDVRIRIYHDTRQVEVVDCCPRHGFIPERPGEVAGRRLLQWKWDINLFLEKWLYYCLAQGHRFYCGYEPGSLCTPRDESAAVVEPMASNR
ncbi:MAG: DUF1249 domain-containing protein [Gammaproteobacteria bacterium]|nr:DUF1249 domain-containing protein [Gammaproteobacteria bacterium]